MPANRRSLGVTDAYRRRMLEIRRKGEQMARQTWGDVDPEDLAGTYKVKPLANGVGTLQRTGVLLSQAYVQAFIKSEIGKDVLIPTPQGFADESFDGVKLRFALWRPVVLVRQLLEQVDMPEAMRRGRDTLLRSVSLATDGAIRDSLTKLYDRQPEIVGWRRAVKGTCDICMGAADGSMLPPGTPLDIHPNCECVSEGVVAKRDWYWKDSETRFGLETPGAVEAQGVKPGTQAAAAARAYTTGAYRDLNRRLVAGEDLTPEQQAIYDSLVKAMRDLPGHPTVWRGLRDIGPIGRNDAETFRLLGNWAEEHFPVGSAVDMKGLQSTSFSTDPALDAGLTAKSPGIVFEIEARNGTYLGTVSNFSDEAELLLREGRFAVQKVLKDVKMEKGAEGDVVHRVVVQLVQQ